MSRIDDLEHESGLRPLGHYPDHCPACRIEDATRKRQEACEHEYVNEVSLWGAGVILRTCADCGLPQDAS